MNVNKESLFLISNSTNFIYLIVLGVFLLNEIHYFKTSLYTSFLFFTPPLIFFQIQNLKNQYINFTSNKTVQI